MRRLGAGVTRKTGKTLYSRIASAVRWLHIYVSLLGFTALIFFAITGITLNHPTWFGADLQTITEFDGVMQLKWLQASPRDSVLQVIEPDAATSLDESRLIDRLSVVEHLRDTHQIRGAVAEFRTDEQECTIIFKGPAYAADVYVDRTSGVYQGTLTKMGLVALMNDLHKGRDSGAVWSWVIDVSALLMIFVSITGLVLVFYLKRKRRSGVLTAVAGTILLAVFYFLWVP